MPAECDRKTKAKTNNQTKAYAMSELFGLVSMFVWVIHISAQSLHLVLSLGITPGLSGVI